MSLKNPCTFSICALCGTLRLVVANCNAWRLGASKEVASRRIRAWQAARRPADVRPLLDRDEDEAEVLLVCQQCLDLVAVIDELDSRLDTAFASLWDRMRNNNNAPDFSAPAPTPSSAAVEYEVIYEDGRKEIRRTEESPPVSVVRKAPDAAAASKYVLLQEDPRPIAANSWCSSFPTVPDVGGGEAGSQRRGGRRVASSSASESSGQSGDEAPLVVDEPRRSGSDEDDAMLLLGFRQAVGAKMNRHGSLAVEHEAMDVVELGGSSCVHGSRNEQTSDASSSSCSSRGEESSHSTDESCAGSPSATANNATGEDDDNDASSLLPVDRKQRKRHQNKEAALRYRLRKKQEMTLNLETLKALEAKNKALRKEFKNVSGILSGAQMLYKNFGSSPVGHGKGMVETKFRIFGGGNGSVVCARGPPNICVT